MLSMLYYKVGTCDLFGKYGLLGRSETNLSYESG